MFKKCCSKLCVTFRSKRLFLLIALSAFFLLTLPINSAAATNPGDRWVFGADSPVTTTHPASQSANDISGNIAVWMDFRPDQQGNPRQRIFYKHLPEPGSPPGTQTPEEVNVSGELANQSYPAISDNVVVWVQDVRTPSGGNGYQIYYSYLGSGISSPVSNTTYGQGQPAVSGSRIVWSEGDAYNTQVHMVDLNDGINLTLSSGTGFNQSPEISGDWVVWVHNDNYSYGHYEINDIYAMNLVSGDVTHITNDSGAVQQEGPAISGSKIIWDVNASGNHSLFIHDLETGQTQGIPESDYAMRADIEGNVVVWERYWPADQRQIFMHDLGTEITQQVSNGTASMSRPKVSSGHIIWTDSRDGSPAIYQNKMGDRAQALAERYAPELHFKHDIDRGDRNDFEPRPVNLMVDAAEKLVTSNGELFNPSIQGLIDHPGQDSYLDLPGSPALFHNYAEDYQSALRQGDYPITAYARVVKNDDTGGKTVIQYWFNYYYNNWYNNHEGDWEMVEVILKEDLEPEAAVYAQHGWPWKKGWDEWGLHKTGTHPQVFVAEGSHASYFFEDSALHFLEPGTVNAFNDTTGSVKSIIPVVDMSGLYGGWADFAGRWGQIAPSWCPWCGNGPKGPAFQDRDPWDQPMTWANNSGLKWLANDLGISIYSPVEVNLYDIQGRHVGKNAVGGIDLEIPGSEYFERAEDHSKNIVIHNADILSNYTVKLEGTGTGTLDLKIQAPDFGGSVIDKPEYLAVNVSPTMKAQLDLTPAKEFSLKMDSDGNGTVEEVRPPDLNNQLAVDFTPPSAITNLAVTGVTADSATLSWSAPGDDGDQGSAFRYNIRYSTQPITGESWQYAQPAESLADPQVAGTAETMTITGLSAGEVQYFAIRAKDDSWQESASSNVVSAYIPVMKTYASSAAAAPANIDAITILVPYTGDENTNGAGIIQYKLTSDTAWIQYGSVSHPAASATITGLEPNAAYDVYVTYQDPDGVVGSAGQLISNIHLPVPPLAASVEPSGTIFGESATINAILSAGLGINPASVSVTLDDNDVSGCTVTATAVSCPVTGLTFGPHSIGGSASDNAGNSAPITGSFEVGDNTPPSVTEVLPIDTVYGGATDIRIRYSDPGIASGIDTSSVSVLLDGTALTGCTVAESNVTCPASGLVYGSHTITGSIADNSGNSSPINGTFTMIEWSEALVIYQSGLVPSQPNLTQLADGRTLLAFTEQLTGAIRFRVSPDGASWEIPSGSTGTVPYAAGVQPSVTQLASGRIVLSYAEYYRNPLNGAYSWVVRVTSSADLINWSYPSTVASGDSLAPSLAPLDNGQVMLTYTRQGANTDLYGRSGSYNGSYWSWNSSSLIYGGALYDSKPSVINAGGGELICAFFSGSNWSADRNTWLSRDIFAVRSLDGGHTWLNQSPVTVYTGTESADFWPSLLKLNSGELICAFTTSDQGNVDQLNIKMVRSADNGYTWVGEQMISTAAHSESWPALAQRPDGSVICVWDSDAGLGSDVYYLYSSRLAVP